MGCAQSKPSMNSPPRGLEKLKLENGYVGARRSTGQKFFSDESDVAFRPDARNKSGSVNGSGSRPSVGIDRERKKDSSGGGAGGGELRRIKSSKAAAGNDELVDGWPKWLTDNIPREVLAGIVPKSAESYDKLDKIGQGTYSNVYKARDRDTGKIVALKKVRFDTSEPESVKFMAREIMILQKLDHPNVVKLEGLATSRMQYSIYLVFDFMLSDLARIISRPDERLTEPQVKCYMLQLLSGLQHCHERGILHRDIKGSNLLIDKNGMLKIADFGLANHFNPKNKNRPLTSRVVTLWYRAPELLLGATDYGVGIDLWSAGCLMAEMVAGRPIMPGRTEVEQLHRIFKLFGTPSEEYWKKFKVSTTFRPPRSYKPSLRVAFCDFPESSLSLLSVLLSLDPSYRGCAGSALQNAFFHTSPLPCDLSGLPVVHMEDDDEPRQTFERRKRRNSKMKQRSLTQKENMRRDHEDTEYPPRVFAYSNEEQDQSKITGMPFPDLEPSSSMTSTSSGSKQTGSPIPKNTKNRPPLPNNIKQTASKYNNVDNGNFYGLSRVQRSISTREFRKLDQRNYYKMDAFKD